ncbi:Probable acylaminoacyl-peptidase [Pseudoalteromonas luteoviolacea B = ATCC 29581]|nr:Probable acylaminoacyl-peptidase [Pseudoalteromonas luteoviolacea B = ATCC 29581]
MKVPHSFLFASLLSFPVASFANKPLQFSDIFDFKTAKQTVLAEDGSILAFSSTPYRGDKQGLVYTLKNNKLLARVDLGSAPHINKSATWVSFTKSPSLLSMETTKKAERKKLPKHLVLVNTHTGEEHEFKDVKDYQLSDDGQWLAYRTTKDDNETETAKATKSESTLTADKSDSFHTLVLVDLTTFNSSSVEVVNQYALSNVGLIWQAGSSDGATNQISLKRFASNKTTTLLKEPGVTVAAFTWQPQAEHIAFLEGNYVNEDNRRREYSVRLFDVANGKLSTLPNQVGWATAKTAKLQWSDNGERLYFGNAPRLSPKTKVLTYTDRQSLTDLPTARAQKGLKIWHHQDAEIKPREINQWNKEYKYQQFTAVYHINSEKVVQLTSPITAKAKFNVNAPYLILENDRPYLHEITHNGFFSDYYSIDVATGKQNLIVKKSRFEPSLSPQGTHAVYFSEGEYWLKQLADQKLSPLTNAIRQTLFADDKHDYPSEQPGYGIAGWRLDGKEVLIYSKYDIWAFNIETLEATQLTTGQEQRIQYRLKKLDKQWLGYKSTDTLLLSGHNLQSKETLVATLNVSEKRVKHVLQGDARYDLVLKAKQAETLIFTKQSYHHYPDYWQTTTTFNKTQQLTNLNPQIKDFAWGETPELVQYKGFDGEDLQGVLIKPSGYQTGQKVPVVIYFYRYMSQRRFDFPKMELNHRPNFPIFTSNGYAVFLPDIRFEIGHPGKSSTQTMINAAQKLIDIGVADPNKIGLQGHSWAGYQSAFMITQTDMFKAVVSGAPVSNMTSAYSGIRLGSGLARQFQYETGQSRIGKTLFEAPELYIENSPVFFADKVNTPILIMFGNKDDAVPYQEGIQYFLALRRANKDVIFLEYEDEPHHLKQFPNQLDFSIRMLEYFDHHLKGKPAPAWMQQGEAYQAE